jgi:hypothetical protein
MQRKHNGVFDLSAMIKRIALTCYPKDIHQNVICTQRIRDPKIIHIPNYIINGRYSVYKIKEEA